MSGSAVDFMVILNEETNKQIAKQSKELNKKTKELKKKYKELGNLIKIQKKLKCDICKTNSILQNLYHIMEFYKRREKFFKE